MCVLGPLTQHFLRLFCSSSSSQQLLLEAIFSLPSNLVVRAWCLASRHTMATCNVEYDKIQTLSHSPLCEDDPLGGITRGQGTGMALNSAYMPDCQSNENVRDVFEWGDSNFSIHSSEISQVSESVFDAMRSG